MTDIERAEKYARENKKIIQCSCHNYDSEKDLEEAYLAGLKAARQEIWHDLRKNQNDLPLVHSTILDENGDKVEYIGYGEWQAYSKYYERYIKVDPPIAWCEIPIFKE